MRIRRAVKLAETLRECAELERRIGGFYEQFAEIGHADPSVERFWRTMAEEEREHARALDELADTLGPASPRHPFDRSAVAQLRGYLTGTGRLLGEVTLDDAFQAALDLESLELHGVYERLVAFLDQRPEVPEEALRTCLTRLGPHRGSLPEMIDRFARRPSLRARVAISPKHA